MVELLGVGSLFVHMNNHIQELCHAHHIFQLHASVTQQQQMSSQAVQQPSTHSQHMKQAHKSTTTKGMWSVNCKANNLCRRSRLTNDTTPSHTKKGPFGLLFRALSLYRMLSDVLCATKIVKTRNEPVLEMERHLENFLPASVLKGRIAFRDPCSGPP